MALPRFFTAAFRHWGISSKHPLSLIESITSSRFLWQNPVQENTLLTIIGDRDPIIFWGHYEHNKHP